MAKHPGGRPRFQPTPEQRARVQELAGFAQTQEAIAREIGIDIKTLMRHFPDEMKRGPEGANLAVAMAIWNAATGHLVQADGTVKRVEPNPTLAIWWSKTRMGWREPATVHEHISAELSSATTEELEARLAELRNRPGRIQRPDPPGMPGKPVGMVH